MMPMMIESANLRGQLLKNAPLAEYTSWRVGGPADYLYIPADVADTATCLAQLPCDFPITWLGLGSNTLIRDKGIAGLVIITQGALNKMQVGEDGYIRVEAGIASAQLARCSARLGWQGLEFMAGIPGTVGGALKMNAGCFGGETWGYVQAVETMDRHGQVHKRLKEAFTVNYRHVALPEEEWFVAGYFQLSKGDKKTSLAAIKNLLARRNTTQPAGTANCGSVFRNPPGDYAGRLIEACGLKGMQIGGAIVSPKHANFIINIEQATAYDIESLIHTVQAQVAQKTGISLQPEVHIFGRK